MLFEEVANSRRCKQIDPCMYEILVLLLKHRKKARTMFSCQGHRQSQPAWLRFDIVDKKWWDKLIAALPEFCKVEDDSIYVYHQKKLPELREKLQQLVAIFDATE